MIWGGVIVAAGRGTRFGRPKQLIEVAGLPLVGWSLRTFAAMPEIADLVLVTEDEWLENMQQLVQTLVPKRACRVVAGGDTRQASVAAGLRALRPEVNAVFVHDGARPLVHAHDVREGMRQTRPGRGAVLCAPVVDTIKVVDPATMLVQRTLDRADLMAAQTPQFAMRRDLERAHAEATRAQFAATDDVALLERIGLEVCAVASSVANIKVTHAEDLGRVEAMLHERLEHAPQEREVLLLEVFTEDALVDAFERELEARGAQIDGVDRDLPQGVIVRAYVPSDALHGFPERFEAFANGTATFTTRFSHYTGAGMRQGEA